MMIFLPWSLCAWGISDVRLQLQENRVDEAAATCRQFEELGSMSNDNFLACAWVYYRSDRPESAERLIEKHKKIFVGPEYHLLHSFGLLKRKQYEAARKEAIAVIDEKKGSALAMRAKEVNAEIYEAQGQLDTAAFIYKQIVGDDPKSGRAHWGLGRYYLVRNDVRRSLYHLETTTQLWPKHMASRYNLGVFFLSQNDYVQAAKWLRECYNLNKADADVLEQLGVLFEKKAMMPEAIKHWQRALEVRKESPIAKEKLNKYVLQVVDTLIEKQEYTQALAQLQVAGRNINDPTKIQIRRGIINRNLGNYETALGDLRAYINANPNDARALRELGICYTNLKLVDQAAGYFNRALNQEPDNGINYAWLAFAFEAKGDLNKARDAWSRALELLQDPKEIERATRKLASLQKRVDRKEKRAREKDDARFSGEDDE